MALTSRDSSVLKALFNPDSDLSSQNAIVVDMGLPSLPGYSEAGFEAIRKEELAILRSLDTTCAELDGVHDVVRRLSALIGRSPNYASAYINRAQATRLLLPTDAIFHIEHSEASGKLLDDLSRGIELATPSYPSQTISTHQQTVLAAGHTHRGLLLLKAAELARKNQVIEGVSLQLQSVTAEKIEELASADFAAGGRYGDRDANQLAIKTNPYAKMCGVIVKEAIRKEIEAGGGEGNSPSSSSLILTSQA